MIGGTGSGKSLLLQALAAQFRERFDVVLLACARVCTRRALLQAILFELGLPYQLRDEGQLRFSVLDHLLSAKQSACELLLLVDEAQSLPITLLDELRIMTNLVHGGSPRVRLVLAGSPALEEAFASPELESLSQRLAARCYLSSFSRSETLQFIRAQLAACGAELDSILTPDASEAVFDATDGVPRLVNQLCDRSILLAVEENCLRVDRRIVQAAWSDLQQLPTPAEAAVPGVSASATVIEFGSLQPEAQAESLRLHAAEPDPDVERCYSGLDAPGEMAPAGEAFEQQSDASPPRDLEPANPFEEPFAEEEIVLDQFASWHNAFSATTPRVQNRHDRGFAARVQQALNGGSRGDEAAPTVSAAELRVAAAETPAASPTAPVTTAPVKAQPGDRPPLRLHDASDSHPVEIDATLSGQQPQPGFVVFAGPETPTVEEAENVGRNVNSPILIIEDDPDEPPAATPTSCPGGVFRQEYRRLFSRLRNSG